MKYRLDSYEGFIMSLPQSIDAMLTRANYIQELVMMLHHADGFTADQRDAIAKLVEANHALLGVLHQSQGLPNTHEAVAGLGAACGVPLQSLEGYSEMLLMGIHGDIPDNHRATFQQIIEITNSIADITRDLMG
jgi:hypothetical protein